MSKNSINTLGASINTQSFSLESNSNKQSMVFSRNFFKILIFLEAGSLSPPLKSNYKLQDREVRHIKITDSSCLLYTFDFGDQIGKGSFGTVMSVVDKQTGKSWAMKIVSKSAVGDKLKTVHREIRILKLVDHPHIIYLHKVYESAKKLYLILERCHDALSTVFKMKRPFSEIDTKKVIRDLTSAVAYLHKNNIVHRDLKLENILIARNPRDHEDRLYIKLIDFGLSIIKEGCGHENMLHDCCGTLIYMAPEIIMSHSYSQQCDVWAVGVIMYMLLSGRLPFYSNTDQELASIICKAEPSYANFTASAEAIHLNTKMLTKNPALRVTAAEVFEDPWIAGKRLAHDKNLLPGNVLDMMRLWRSEMTLPVEEECDWVKSARAIGSISSLANDVVDKKESTRSTAVKNNRPETIRSQKSISNDPQVTDKGVGANEAGKSKRDADPSLVAPHASNVRRSCHRHVARKSSGKR